MMPPSLARTRSFIHQRRRRIEHSCSHAYRCLSTAPITPESNNDHDGINTISPINTSLALSVHFRYPEGGMKDYEILSRATAFLMKVDPPEDPSNGGGGNVQVPQQKTSTSHDAKGHVKKSAFPHLKENKDLRKKLLLKQDYAYDPAAGPPRLPHQLNWLEFCPSNFRPLVHVVSSSHVISPWLWPKYYGQDWLKVLKQEHVRYSLEVWGQPSIGGGKKKKSSGIGSQEQQQIITHDGKLQGDYQPLAKFALSPYPIHHPQEMDVALIHLKGEEEALRQLKSLGVQPLHLPSMYEMEMSNDPTFQPGERVLFQGFQVDEANATDQETLASDDNATSGEAKDDERVFHPYSSLGELTMASPDRFLARTNGGPIPEGLCGGPVIQMPKEMTNSNTQHPLKVRGVIEGIIPPTHDNKELAGLASFIPFYRIREFVDFAERIMLEQIVDPGLFQRIVRLKEQKDQGRTGDGTTYKTSKDGGVREVDGNEEDDDEDEEITDPGLRAAIEGTSEDGEDTPHLDAEYQRIVASLHENHTPQEVDAILGTVEREQAEVLKIWETEGGDIDDIINRVRRQTYEEKDRILKEIEMEMIGEKKGTVEEGEIVSSKDDEQKK